MEAELILCDTDVMVEFFKKNIPVLQLMNELGAENLFISVIT